MFVLRNMLLCLNCIKIKINMLKPSIDNRLRPHTFIFKVILLTKLMFLYTLILITFYINCQFKYIVITNNE